MCAPHEPRGEMEEPSISRFNSQSTNKTLVGSDNGLVSPIFTPLASVEGLSVTCPIVSTPDNKQWIDLDVLTPKLVKELRRQYDRSIKDGPSGPLEKGAAKIKAFVRQTKLGIDIRLRRKLNAEQDEVTDIHLVPDSALPEQEFREEKLHLLPELPATQNEINELPNSSVLQELDATHAPSRTSTGSSIVEPLPRYEPRRESNIPPVITTSNHERTRSPERFLATLHHPSASQSSIISTPTRGLSLRDPGSRDVGSDFLTKNLPDTNESYLLGEKTGESTGRSFEGPQRQHDEESQITESLQTILAALHKKRLTSQDQAEGFQGNADAEEVFGPFKVTKRTIYETETDAEPSSPVARKATRPSRKRSIALPKRKRSNTKPKTRTSGGVDLSIDSDDEGQPKVASLLRMQTIPKRLPASSGAEALWSSLIRTQSKILGPEHPLVYQSKSDWAHSRANSHAKGFKALSSLTKSKTIATETLGLVHPWVASFAEDLKTLESLIGEDSSAHVADTSTVTLLAGSGSMPYDTDNPASIESSELREEHVRTASESSALLRNVESMDESHKNASEPLSAGQIKHDIQCDDVGASSSHQTTSGETRPEMPRITTSFHPTEPTVSSAESSAARSVHSDELWNSWHSPHKPRSDYLALPTLAFDGLLQVALNAIQWLQWNYGPERPVKPGKVRVRWTCSCGEQLHDDFIERKQGAARELEKYLNRPRIQTPGSGGTPTSPASSYGGYSFGSSSLGAPPSSQTSWSSYGLQGQGSMRGNGDSKLQQTSSGLPVQSQYSPFYEPPWLLTCANEDRHTPKLAHLDMAPHKITSDRDLAKQLCEHYFTVNKKWWRSLRIRGLTTIEFVQFEVHSNRFCDIRKCPDMPETTGDYMFEPADLLPPVGSQYLLHLFQHPEDYDGELITYLRAPKRNGRLHLGVGWGINLVEGFLADRVWILVSGFFGLGSIIFAIAWEMKKHDVQGASGIAAWILSFSILVVGWLQAFLG